MDHVYSVFRNEPMLQARSFLQDGNANVVSSISNNNVLAFTSSFDLNDSSQKHLGVFLYVADLNLPYFPYLVTFREDNITILEWDDNGTKLLIGDEVGNIEIWSMRDFLISEWMLVYSSGFSGDSIVAGIWFHKGVKLMINYDKKENSVYQDKFQNKIVSPSVVQFGGKHADGYLCITSSGFVYAHVFCSDGNINGFEFLNNNRQMFQKVDISYAKNGNFLVIATNGNSNQPLACYNITISINLQEKQKLRITCQSFSSFSLCSESFLPDKYPNINYLKFVVKDSPDAVVISASGKAGSIVELWELHEKAVTFHNAIHNLLHQQNQKVEVSPQFTTWKLSFSSSFPSQVSAIGTPFACLFEANSALSHIIIAFKDNTIKCFHREHFQLFVSVDLATILSHSVAYRNGHKKSMNVFGPSKFALGNVNRNSCNFSFIRSIQLTWSNCVMIALDSFSQIHLFRISPVMEQSTAMSQSYAQLMLEYSLLSGNDNWDILMNIKPAYVDSLCDRLTENFLIRQSQSIQQKWFDSILQLKSSLYRCVNPGPSTNNFCKAGDYYTIKMLNAISETLKRLIRARELESEGPAEKLSYLIQSKPTETSIDKILLKLDNKDFCVEPVTQQSFKHLLQWVCDLSLYILASIPQQYHQNQYRLPGVGLIFDSKSINTLREILVIVRFWGMQNPLCLPNVVKMQDNFDAITLIFKLLSRIVASTSDRFDESLVDECCLLPNQVQIPQMDLCPKSIGIASPLLYSSTLPLMFEYNVEPVMKYSVKVHTIDGAINLFDNHHMDVVRYIAMAEKEAPSNIRRCTRCSSVSLRKIPMRSPASRAWEHQWSKKCFCGGHWRVHAQQTNLE